MSEEVLKSAIQSIQDNPDRIALPLLEKEARAHSLALMKRSPVCLLGTAGENGFVNIRALLNLKHRGLKKAWFSTNTSSQKVAQIKQDRRVCLYFMDEKNYEGLRLTGYMDILQDLKSRRMLWTEGSEVYYPQGINDPDYTVLGFTALQANYYHGLKNITFVVE